MQNRFDGESGYNQGYSDPVYNREPENSFGGPSQPPLPPLNQYNDNERLGDSLNNRGDLN